MKFPLIGVIVTACVGLSACNEERYGYFALELDKDPILMSFPVEVDAASKNNYVSIAPLANEKYVLANYANLILLDRKEASLCKLSAQDNAGVAIQSKSGDATLYNPTGVYTGPDGRVFVANYKADNILVGRVDVANCTFVVESTFSAPETKGPENVVVDKESDLLISANYDSGTVVAFKLDSGEKVWVASVPQAHGVTVSGGKVYATGLTERKIYELDRQSGAILRSKGSIGWDPMAAQYMWPTSIYPLANGNIIVSDPQSGYVSVLDPKTLDVLHYTGGNGPAQNLLNYPYAAVPNGKELIVLSSMRGSILFLNQKNMDVAEKFSFAKEHWPGSSAVLPVFGGDWSNYEDMSGFSMKLAGRDYRLGFGNLHPLEGGAVFKVPDISSLFNPSNYIYFMQGYSAGNVGLMFSSSTWTLLATVSKPGNPDILLPKFISIDSWKVGDNLVSGSRGDLPFKYLVDEVQETADAYYQYLGKKGWVDAEHLYSLLNFAVMGLDYSTFQTYLHQAFISPAGREFKLIYDQCLAGSCDRQRLSDAARRYYREAAGYSYLAMDEFYLVGMVSGVSTDQFAEVGVDYDDCGSGRYYDGYGLQALITPALDDYLSAVDLAHSSVCLSVKGQGVVRGLEVVWNDVATVPKSIEIYGSTGADASQWKLIREFDSIKVAERNGYAVSNFSFGKAEVYSRLQLKVIDGGIQNRLIMRQANPVIEEVAGVLREPEGPFEFVGCPGASTYPGYGIEALNTSTLNDYFSSVSTEQSSVCFSNSSGGELSGLSFGWYSAGEVGELVELFGSKSKDFKSEVSLGKYSVSSTYDISGFVFSNVSVKSKGNYPHYRIKLLKGEGQNRLILRSLTPLYSPSVPGGDGELHRIAAAVSAEFDYGEGVSKVVSEGGRSLADIEKVISSSDDAHCGNYALVFVNRLPKNASWRVFDLSTRDGRVHSVVEVKRNERVFVYDPTLGVEYRCTLDSMINGKCNYSADLSYYQVNPVLQVFRGAGFFYGAQINRVYSSSEDLMSAYF